MRFNMRVLAGFHFRFESETQSGHEASAKMAATSSFVGTWRSLVAHLLGVQGVGGSNPPVPTNFFLQFNSLHFKQQRQTRIWVQFGSNSK